MLRRMSSSFSKKKKDNSAEEPPAPSTAEGGGASEGDALAHSAPPQSEGASGGAVMQAPLTNEDGLKLRAMTYGWLVLALGCATLGFAWGWAWIEVSDGVWCGD